MQNREQYGAEGLIISIIISLVGLCFVFIHIFSKRMSYYLASILSAVLLFIVFLLVWGLEGAYKDKGWYNPRHFPPGDYQKGWFLLDQGNNI